MGEAYGVDGRGGGEPHTSAALQGEEASGRAQRGRRGWEGEAAVGRECRGATLAEEHPSLQTCRPRCNNGPDNDTGGGISAALHHPPTAQTHTHTQSSAFKSAAPKMNDFLIAFICYNYHN